MGEESNDLAGTIRAISLAELPFSQGVRAKNTIHGSRIEGRDGVVRRRTYVKSWIAMAHGTSEPFHWIDSQDAGGDLRKHTRKRRHERGKV